MARCSTAAVNVLYQASVSLSSGPGITEWFTVNLGSVNRNATILTAVATDTSGAVVSSNVVALTTPQYMQVPLARILVKVSQTPNPDGSYNVTMSTNNVGVYVVLTTMAHGRFSDNAMLVLPPLRTVQVVYRDCV